MATVKTRKPTWWGGRAHITYTIVVFVILASLDNAALALLLAMSPSVESAFSMSAAAVGFIVGAQILVTALTAVAWGYAGDARSRKPLLLWGTLIWSTAEFISTTSSSFGQLLVWQLLAAVGLGSIASVGFSVIADFISPKRRGLAMSFWGISQGFGGIIGFLVASQLGASDPTQPFAVLGVLGFVFAFLYMFTFDPPRGFREPELRKFYESGGEYEHRIDRSQLKWLAKRRTNVWLVLQGVTAQVAYGALVWSARLYQEKVIAEGYSVETGVMVGGLFAVLFQIGGLLSIIGGLVGDAAQRRSLRGRAIVSTVGILGALPFFLVFFWVPLRGLEVTEGASTLILLGEVVVSMFTNPWVMLAFVSSLLALAFTSADSPNWFALITDVNLPEHRGTVFGVGNLANGGGRFVGSWGASIVATNITRSVPPPFNWATSLTVSLAFFLPTSFCYWKASQTSPGDITEVREILAKRGANTAPPSREPPPPRYRSAPPPEGEA